MTLHKRVRKAIPDELARAYAVRDDLERRCKNASSGYVTKRRHEFTDATTEALRAEIKAGRAGE